MVPRSDNGTNGTEEWLPPPTEDPFYKAPKGWAKTTPGTALKTRLHAYPKLRIRYAHDTFQVVYRTTDTIGNPSWALGTVFIPNSRRNCSETNIQACGHAIVSYQVPTDSSYLNAAPSYLLQARDPYGEVRDLLANGWYVFVPDYEGPLASFCAGVQAGHATLDGIKAVISVGDQFGLRKDRAKVAMWGYSGGAFATVFAAELARTYSPDLKIAGTVIGGPSPNLTTVDLRMNKKDTAGLVIQSIIGITNQQPVTHKFLMDRLRSTGPYNATEFLTAANMTGIDSLIHFAYQDVNDYFINGEQDFWDPALQGTFESDAKMGLHGVPNMPTFVYKAIQDEMSPVAETDTLVKGYCDGGASLLYHRNALGGHNDELWMGRARTIDFLSTVLDGTGRVEMPASGCQIMDVSIPMNTTGLLPDDMSNWDNPDNHIPGSKI
ncbi:LIP-domain-containing protein [Thozetella sp. PMI_491]|nr:LIP-domain-containing protein [Thozetella sp. PMI_491]